MALTDHNINNIINAVNTNNFQNTLLLLPSLNLAHIQIAYEDIINEPNMSVNLILSRSRYNIYFCKINNQVFQVVTDEFTERFFKIEEVFNNQF